MNTKDSLGVPSARGWGWIGWGPGFKENILVRVSAASVYELPPYAGHLDNEEDFMQAPPCYLPRDTHPTRELCLNFLQATVTLEQPCWHFDLPTISSKQWPVRFIFLTTATKNVVHSIVLEKLTHVYLIKL